MHTLIIMRYYNTGNTDSLFALQKVTVFRHSRKPINRVLSINTLLFGLKANYFDLLSWFVGTKAVIVSNIFRVILFFTSDFICYAWDNSNSIII
jgi:hypothetical protein